MILKKIVYRKNNQKKEGFKLSECLLDPAKDCDNCQECDRCDLENSKKCDNCCRCLDEPDYRGIKITEILIPEAVKVKWKQSPKGRSRFIPSFSPDKKKD